MRRAEPADLPRIEEIYAHARQFMADHGNPTQWGKTHPPTARLKADIRERKLYVISRETQIHGVFFFDLGPDATYALIDGSWHSDSPYGVIHRIAGDGTGGILAAAVAYAWRQLPHIRIDTHADNHVMQKALARQGFHQCGIIHIADGTLRIAYNKI